MEMSTMGTPKMSREERRYSVPYGPGGNQAPLPPGASEDLHAWSIYRQNLNSDFTDSALGSSDKSPLPYGNFQLRDTTVQSIINHPRYGPKSPLGSNMYTYLKFGLPRVFPPNGGSQRSHKPGPGPGRGRVNRGFRDSNMQQHAGSSGYDSSDNETTRASRQPPKNLRKFRSESDFRMLNSVVHNGGGHHMHSRPSSRAHGGIPVTALKQVNSRASIAGPHYAQHNGVHRPNGHHRSHSEADLLAAAELNYDYDPRGYDTRDMRSMRGGDPYNMSRRQSIHNLIYPNIQVHCLDVSPMVRGVSLQAKAGDLFAVMATSSSEGTMLMETLAGLRERMSGEILINGQHVSKKTLRKLCGYVAAAESAPLDPRMNVQSTLRYHSMLRGPVDKSDIKDRIDILVEDLGLSAIRAANISRLTHSEKQRLNVACQLLTQSSIMILDQATNNMDIFDTFFLVEYLRQWCNGSRIIIMTLQPPTFEILSMCSGVLLLSGGRIIFSGSRSDLPRHMGSLGYPCPPFKNPADYYLDLVTLDDLSAAALLESSSRIEALANAWDRINSEPPLAAPKASLPQPVVKAGTFKQFFALCKRSISYKQPGSLLSWISKLILAAILSLLIGTIFWDVPASDPKLSLNDRLGYHHAIMSIGLWPLLLCFIRDTHEDRRHAEKDLKLDLYGRTVYILVQSIMSVLPSLCIWIAFLLPAHSMAGLYSYKNDSGIYMYLGYMLLFLMAIQTLALFCAHFLPTKVSSSVLLSLIVFILSAVGGYMIHPSDISPYWKWLEVASPQKWTTPILAAYEFSKETLKSTVTLECKNKQIQHQEIIVKDTCPPPNGTAVLAEFKLLPEDHVIDPSSIFASTSAALIFACVSVFILTFLVFLANCQRGFIRKSKKRAMK